jgi:hypothetical protein
MKNHFHHIKSAQINLLNNDKNQEYSKIISSLLTISTIFIDLSNIP